MCAMNGPALLSNYITVRGREALRGDPVTRRCAARGPRAGKLHLENGLCIRLRVYGYKTLAEGFSRTPRVNTNVFLSSACIDTPDVINHRVLHFGIAALKQTATPKANRTRLK